MEFEYHCSTFGKQFQQNPVQPLSLNGNNCNFDQYINQYHQWENTNNQQPTQYNQETNEQFSFLENVDFSKYLDNCKYDFCDSLRSFANLADKIDHNDNSSQSEATQPNYFEHSTQLNRDSRQSSIYGEIPSLNTPQSFRTDDISPRPTTSNTTDTSTPLSNETASNSPSWPLSPASSGRSSASVSDGCSFYSNVNEDNDECGLYKHRHNNRRQKNASAAGKYRRRLKGRQRVVHTEMEIEEAKNRQLRRQLDSKLSLYREFVDLLAENTTHEDTHLASKGLESLRLVLQELKGHSYEGNEHLASDLHAKYVKFQEIILKHQ